MLLLAIETSCDETSVAVVADGAVLANVVASQAVMHAEYGGVVPELAAREHLRNLAPTARAALAKASTHVRSLDAIAVTRGPGLPSALSAGVRAALAMGLALGKPVMGIHHHEAHLYSAWTDGDPLVSRMDTFQPNISLIVSGGHTLLAHVAAPFKHRVLGGTVDDAAGECFDKTAKLIGLAYPGGPLVDRLARDGQRRTFPFPRPKRDDPDDDFSFSGLKTAVRYFLRDHPSVLDRPEGLRDVCAGVQEAIVDVLVTKTVRAALRLGVPVVTASGGVACNSRFREALRSRCDAAGLGLRIASAPLCTDNAAMVGLVGFERHRAGLAEWLGLDAEGLPGWALGEAQPGLPG